MTKEESLKLFRYFSAQFAKINKQLENMATKDDINKILNTLDGHRGQIDTLTAEYTAVSVQLSRHERWIVKAARRLGIPYRVRP